MSTQSFGKYQLVKKLATGGMAEVWLARQTGIEGFDRQVVLKRILPHLAEDPEFVQMFLNEARVAAKFNHPNIAQIYDLGETNGTYFIAMEYIHGEDLGRVMRKAWSTGQWIAQQLALRIVAACCEGLYYAHERKDERGQPLRVVHRDISPQNILISFDGSVKLVDFGIAKAADLPSLTKSGAIKGKFAYMAPEQAAGKALDHRADIFAIGLVLFELITGVRPLKRDSEIATLQAALECAIQRPSEVAEVASELDDVVMNALAKSPDDRYRDARQFQMRLEEYLAATRQVAGSVQISELMNTLFADRLEEEAKSGEMLPPSEASHPSKSGPEEVSRTAHPSRNAQVPVAWEAPPASGQQSAQKGGGARGMAKGNYNRAPSEPAPPPPASVAAWEAPPGVDAAPRRTRTGMSPVGGTGVGEVGHRTENGTAIARTPSRPDISRPSTRSVIRTRTAVPEEDDRDEVEERPARAPARAERAERPERSERSEDDSRDEIVPPKRSASTTGIPRTASKSQLRRMTGSNLARAVDPAEDRDEVAPARALDEEEAQPRKRRMTGEVRAPARSGEKPRAAKASGEKPKRTMSKEVQKPAASSDVDEYIDLEAYQAKSRKRLRTVLFVSSLAAAALLAFVFRDAILATLTAVPATGQGIFVSVEANVPVQVKVKHHKDENATPPVEALSAQFTRREVRLPGAHLRDTIILENEKLGIYFQHEVEFGQPGDLVELKKEFRTGHLKLVLKPQVRDVFVWDPRTNTQLGSTNLSIELAEGEHKLELRGEALKKPQLIEVRIPGGGTHTQPVALTTLDASYYK